ncbi:MAG TPA: HAD-IA family hydrolase [Drouetiella sp.]
MKSDNLNWVADIKAWLFDLDGTLIDSRIAIDTAWRTWCKKHNLPADEIIHKAHGQRAIDSLKILTPHLNAAEEAAFLEKLECELVEGLVALPDVHALLEELKEIPWAIVTSGSNKIASHRIQFTKVPNPKYFVCADDVVNGKPHPEGYLRAASEIGIEPSQCVVVEDAAAGVRAGKAAGMHVIGVTTTHRAEELQAAGADLVCDSLTELVAVIKKSKQAKCGAC